MNRLVFTVIVYAFAISCSTRKRIQTKPLHTELAKLEVDVPRQYIVDMANKHLHSKLIGKVERTETLGLKKVVVAIPEDQLDVLINGNGYTLDTLEGKAKLCRFTFRPQLTPIHVHRRAIRGAFFYSASDASHSLEVDLSAISDPNTSCEHTYQQHVKKWLVYIETFYQKNIDPYLPQKTCNLRAQNCHLDYRLAAQHQLVCNSMQTGLHFCEVTTDESQCTAKGSGVGAMHDPKQLLKLLPFCNTWD